MLLVVILSVFLNIIFLCRFTFDYFCFNNLNLRYSLVRDLYEDSKQTLFKLQNINKNLRKKLEDISGTINSQV